MLRNVVPDVAEWRRWIIRMSPHECEARPGKRWTPRQHLVHNDAQRILVARARELLRIALLGAHVQRRPDDRAGLGECRVLRHLGDAEVGYDSLSIDVEQ